MKLICDWFRVYYAHCAIIASSTHSDTHTHRSDLIFLNRDDVLFAVNRTGIIPNIICFNTG